MFSIGPFNRPSGQPAGHYASLLPLEPEPLDCAAAPRREPSPAPAAPSMARHAVSMAVLLGLTLAVHSAVGWWTLPGHAPVLAPSAQKSAPATHVATARAPS
ncbi:hypothetical protein [Methylobacterium nonmethylotrophicum]|uniref:Uncharacterized protein n=1 Tax=Methylobacterium nonmethylotrophicum TaxID=1141884 RepID=A0A4Z0NFJ0_9HYPH|nr:hypothetical protein [Methylobacterium nonmethylotrophicum]TGD93308.1 hypothetical protein EU555_33510 [Methylobacterium nonmethylotrophicum]